MLANIQKSEYSSRLTKNSPIYSPDYCNVSNHYYEAIQLTVSSNGCYTFISESNIGIIESIYNDSFDVFMLNSNLLLHYHGNKNDIGFNFTVQLETKITYVLILSTYLPSMMGTFSITVYGASKVKFTRMSK